MIEVRVTLNDEVFEFPAPGNVYDGDMPDYTWAVNEALHLAFVRDPLRKFDVPTLVVSVGRVYTDTAARDGVTESVEPEPEDLSEEELELATAPEPEPEFIANYEDEPEEAEED